MSDHTKIKMRTVYETMPSMIDARVGEAIKDFNEVIDKHRLNNGETCFVAWWISHQLFYRMADLMEKEQEKQEKRS